MRDEVITIIEEIVDGQDVTLIQIRRALEGGEVLARLFPAPSWDDEKEERTAGDEEAEEIVTAAWEIVCDLIENFGPDFPVNNYIASCSLALEGACFADEESAGRWVAMMNESYPVPAGSCESRAYYQSLSEFCKSV